MAETKTDNFEREYTSPRRVGWKKVPRYKRTNRAVTTVKEFLVRHMKIRDRDLKKIKINMYLNEALWFRGIRNPPSRIRVKAIRKGEIVSVELVEMVDKLKFKKAREEKMERNALELIQKKKTFMEKAKEGIQKPQTKEEQKEEVEKKDEEKEKKAAVVEEGEKMEKAAAKQAKHLVGGKTKQPKHRQRKALEK